MKKSILNKPKSLFKISKAQKLPSDFFSIDIEKTKRTDMSLDVAKASPYVTPYFRANESTKSRRESLNEFSLNSHPKELVCLELKGKLSDRFSLQTLDNVCLKERRSTKRLLLQPICKMLRKQSERMISVRRDKIV